MISFYIILCEIVLSFLENLEFNFNGLLLESFKLIERKMICCTSMITNPKPNSTAERIKKKKAIEEVRKAAQTLQMKLQAAKTSRRAPGARTGKPLRGPSGTWS